MDKVLEIAARILMSHIYIISGWSKLSNFSGTSGYFAHLGLPMPAVVTPLVILIELGGGLALLLGFKTRWVAAMLALFSVATAVVAHTNFADPNQMNNFMKNLAMAGGYLLFVKYGAGAPSMDNAAARKRSSFRDL
ncbi:putative oxidoreductase [Paucimonas lemoignei]|uniref:Putative oxidoreductase n=1 Tax=Paucimonas lemoignei TaxID=29443 RepID=A0A4R3I3U8_PAULE|nr:DoxX family protein [Paucimonas lemoignei]TCS38609.1 putative oxidoreductase [Paucimonas lemoignei]